MFGALLIALAASSIGCSFTGTKPGFQIPFQNATIEAGKAVIFVCDAEGEKPMTYKWYNQDEDEMTEDDNLLVYVKDWGNDSSLIFKNLSREHEGSYTCTARNVHGMASKVFSLKVPSTNGMKPEFRNSSQNFTFVAGSTMMHLLCTAEGAKPMTYRWYNQDGEEMIEDDKQPVFVRQWESDSSLVFRNLSMKHRGSYTCTANNTYGLDSKVFSLRVTPPNGMKPEFRNSSQNFTFVAGSTMMHLLCTAQGAKPMTYRWYNQVEEEMIEDDKQPVFVRQWKNDSSLVFRNVSMKHDGSYTCTANNSYGLASKVFSLRVTPPSGMKPEFRIPFENFTFSAGSTLPHLLCTAQGAKPMTYRWYNQEGEEIIEDDKQPYYIRQWESDSSLVFSNLSMKQEGSYTCTANNTYGLASKVFSLRVTPPSRMKPEFRIPSQNFTFVAGSTLMHLLCTAEGAKPMTYRWFNQDKDEMTDDDMQPVFVKQWDSDSSLIFRNLSMKYEGSYTCNAYNNFGFASKVFFLRVSDGNDTDIDHGNGTSRFLYAKVLKYTTRSVRFNLTTSGPVKYIEAKYREGKRALNTTIIRLHPAPGNNSYEIRNLLPSGLYRFQFRTVPSQSSKWSREYNVTLLPEAPEIILENTCNRSIKLQWFAKTDDSLRGTIDRHQIKYFPVDFVDGWTSRNCSLTTEVPTCVGSSYTIWGLEQTTTYHIEVRAHTEAGYGEPWRQKVYLP